MKNQFFYTEKRKTSGKDEIEKSFRCSFSTRKIIRSMEMDNGSVLIILDDIHQRPQYIDIKNKQGKITSTKREMNTFQSEIYITEPADIERFYALTNIDDVSESIYNPDTTDEA